MDAPRVNLMRLPDGGRTARILVLVALFGLSAAPSGCSAGDDSAQTVDAPAPDAAPDAAPDVAATDTPPADTAPLPPPDRLSEPVEVVVDDNGVPHLYAANDTDLFFAAGYQLAADRLFTVDMYRRRATGRQAEVLGEGSLTTDRLMRTFGFAHVAPRSLALVRDARPADYRLLQAYVSGLNRRVDEVLAGDAPLPPPFGPDGWDYAPSHFAEEDILAIGTMVVFGFSATIESEIVASIMLDLMPERDQFPSYDPGVPVYIMESATGTEATSKSARAGRTPLPARRGPYDRGELRACADGLARLQAALPLRGGSNNWVVAGRHTANGRPYLLNDPHVPYSAPNDLYFVHLNSADRGGAFDVIGYSFPGVPGVQLGHNGRLAWASTVNFADVSDVWDVQITGEGAHVGDAVVPVETRTETIRVRLPEGGEREDAWPVRTVPGHGVLLPSEVLPVPTILFARGAVLMNWVGFEPTAELVFYTDLDRAADLADFEAAVDLQRNGMMNWIGATAEGYRYKVHGLVPDRGPLAGRPAAHLVMDASDPRSLWSGAFLPDENLPYIGDDRAYVVSANNDPWGHNRDGDPANDEFYYGAYYLPGYRAARIVQRLDELLAAGPVTIEQMEALQMDAHSVLADLLLPLLAEAVAAIDSDPELAPWRDQPAVRAAADRLLAWDHEAVRGSHDAALYRLWYAFLSRRTLGDEMTLLFEGLDQLQPIILARMLSNVLLRDIEVFEDEPRAVLLLASLADAVAEIERRGGAGYTFGDLLRATFAGPDGAIVDRLAKDGDDSAVNVSQCSIWRDGALTEHCESNIGAIFRMSYAFDEDGTPRARFNLPHGNAGTTEDWVEGAFRPVHFRRTDVDAHTTERRTIAPR